MADVISEGRSQCSQCGHRFGFAVLSSFSSSFKFPHKPKQVTVLTALTATVVVARG